MPSSRNPEPNRSERAAADSSSSAPGASEPRRAERGARQPEHAEAPRVEDRTGDDRVDAPRADYAPTGADTGTSFGATLKRTVKEFIEDKLTDQAAGLTYYGVLALFPALIAVVSVLGLFADPAATTRNLTEIVESIAPGSAADTLQGPIESLTSSSGAAGITFVLGLVGALYSASSYVGAFSRSANVVYETPEGRSFLKLKAQQLLLTLVLVVLAVVVVVALVLTGPVVDAVAGTFGLSDVAVTVWSFAKWPVLVLIVLAMIGLLYWASPNVRVRGGKFFSAGAVLALVVFVVASAGFAFYVASFGSYNKTYGALAGAVVLLVWGWLINVALLLGIELNAELERSRELSEQVPRADREIQLEPRAEPKAQQTT